MQVVTVLVLVLVSCTHAQGQSVDSATLHFIHTIQKLNTTKQNVMHTFYFSAYVTL